MNMDGSLRRKINGLLLILRQTFAHVDPMAEIGHHFERLKLAQIERCIPGREKQLAAMRFMSNRDTDGLFQPERLLKKGAPLFASHAVAPTLHADLDWV